MYSFGCFVRPKPEMFGQASILLGNVNVRPLFQALDIHSSLTKRISVLHTYTSDCKLCMDDFINSTMDHLIMYYRARPNKPWAWSPGLKDRCTLIEQSNALLKHSVSLILTNRIQLYITYNYFFYNHWILLHLRLVISVGLFMAISSFFICSLSLFYFLQGHIVGFVAQC